MSEIKLMLSHTLSIAAQLPASNPLPTAAADVAKDCCAHSGLKPCHSPRNQSVRSRVKPSYEENRCSICRGETSP